ncbi:hypothetical protein PMAYCL1PPCAC_08607, partial [Pristionchus mayeri]
TNMMIEGLADGEIPSQNDHMGWAKLATQIYTGLFFSSYAIRDVKWHLQAGNENVWLFTYAHRSLLPFNREIDGWIPISHSSELPYLWFYPDVWENNNISKADLAVAEKLGTIWTDFAKYGTLSFPKVENSMNFIEIGEKISMKPNWSSKANDVFNERFPAYVGQFPPLKIAEKSWTKMKQLGAKVLSKWNAVQCLKSSTFPSTTRDAPNTSIIALTILMLTQSLRLMILNIR